MGEITGEQHQISSPSKPMALILLGLRLAVGWHFLYEGLAKLLIPGWTSAPYLLFSHGIFSGFFHWLGSSPGLIRAVDILNIWGLILIGLALILGCFCRVASASGIVLLALYYFAHPPFIQSDFRIPLRALPADRQEYRGGAGFAGVSGAPFGPTVGTRPASRTITRCEAYKG